MLLLARLLEYRAFFILKAWIEIQNWHSKRDCNYRWRWRSNHWWTEAYRSVSWITFYKLVLLQAGLSFGILCYCPISDFCDRIICFHIVFLLKERWFTKRYLYVYLMKMHGGCETYIIYLFIFFIIIYKYLLLSFRKNLIFLHCPLNVIVI